MFSSLDQTGALEIIAKFIKSLAPVPSGEVDSFLREAHVRRYPSASFFTREGGYTSA